MDQGVVIWVHMVGPYGSSSPSADKPETFADDLLNVLIFVLQQRERISHIGPLLLGLATLQTSRQLLRQLFGVFVLYVST